MGSFTNNSFSDAPVMIMSPSAEHRLPSRQNSNPSKSANSTAFPAPLLDQPSTTSYPNNSSSWTPTQAVSPICTNPSRKRSRDDTSFEPDRDGSFFPSLQSGLPAPIPEEGPVGTKGMGELNLPAGISAPSESQTGTGHEGQGNAQLPSPSSSCDSDTRLNRSTSRKIARILPTTPPPSTHDIAVGVAPTTPTKAPPSSPQIDDFTLVLGIGWTRLSVDDPDMQAAARGWARFLENHYSTDIHEAEILLKSKGLNAYLVGCREGFYLFNEDLLEGRLVGRSWKDCLTNLKSEPMAFEGQDVLKVQNTTVVDVTPCRTAAVPNVEDGHGLIKKGDTNGNENGTASSDGGMEID